MTSIPFVSVLLPCHNCGPTLAKSLDSLLGQSFPHFEILAVNNGSTDQTESILHAYARADQRVKVLHLKQAGIVAALNHGLQRARGEYIARMDADDISLPHRLQAQVDYMQAHPRAGLIGGLVVHQDSAFTSPGRAAYVQWQNSLITPDECALHRFVECPLAHPTFMFRRSSLSRLGGYRYGPFPEDYELVLRWAESGVELGKVPEPILIWPDDPERLSRQDPRYFAPAMYSIKSPFLARWLAKNNPHHPWVVVLGAGRESRRQAALLEQEGIRIKYYADISPGRMGQKIHGRPVISVHELPIPGYCFCLSCVGQRGAGSQVSAFLQRRGYILGRDFLLAA